jgi:hypothetical protein
LQRGAEDVEGHGVGELGERSGQKGGALQYTEAGRLTLPPQSDRM